MLFSCCLLAPNRKNQHYSAAALTSVQAVATITSMKLALSCAKHRDFEHVAFRKLWCRKNVTKKCIRTSESSRVGARRSRVTASTRNNPACEHLSTTSALVRLLTPGAAFATLLLRGALLEQPLSQDIAHSQSGLECATLRGKPGRVTRMHQQRHA